MQPKMQKRMYPKMPAIPPSSLDWARATEHSCRRNWTMATSKLPKQTEPKL